jgi:hypothetical protein
MKAKLGLVIFIIFSLVVAKNYEGSLKNKKEELYPKSNNVIEKAEEPEQVLGTLMLGGFRVFVSDLLWFRMVTLEETGEYHELIMTANLISSLQPSYTSVWEYLAFVISNNISGKETDPQLKLEWVKSAIDYLYKGLKRNPDSGMLYVAMGRTINEKLGIYKERMLNHYFKMREEGYSPHDMARHYFQEAIKTNNYQVYSEREYFICNSYWVKEALFHLRNSFKNRCLLAHAILADEKEEVISKLGEEFDSYQSKFGKEGTLEEVGKRISVAVNAIKDATAKYPNQYDFTVTLEQHTAVYEDIYERAKIIAGWDADIAILAKNGRQNHSEEDLRIDLLEIEIILLRVNILESEYIDDGGKTINSYLQEIARKIQLKKEKKTIDEPQK